MKVTMTAGVFLLALSCLASGLRADSLTLTDGSVLKGKVIQKADGNYVVETAAGPMEVAKDKVTRSVADGAAPSDGLSDYERKVYEKRRKAGNDDGIARLTLTDNKQMMFHMGYHMMTGDALANKPGYQSNDLSGIAIQAEITNTIRDYFAWERWVAFSLGNSMNRFDVGVTPRLQAAIHAGDGLTFVPYFGIGPAFTAVGSQAGSALCLGGAADLGIDVRMGKAIVGLKARYLAVSDLKGDLASGRNYSGFLPTLGVGLAF
jgi:hypothetical protein